MSRRSAVQPGGTATTGFDGPELCRALIQSSPDCVKLLSLDGRLEMMNENGLRAMEIDDFGSVAGRSWSALWPTEERDKTRSAIAAALRGEAARFQGFCPTALGDPRWWDVSVSLVSDGSGQPWRLLAVSRDVTTLKSVNETLVASEARYRLLADNATDIIVRTDAKGAFLYVSPSCRALGYEPEELIGRTTSELIHPDDAADLAANDGELFSGAPIDRAADRERRVRRKNGGWVWLEGNPQVIRDSAGRPIEIVNVLRDVTERRRLRDAALEQARFGKMAEEVAGVGYWRLDTETRAITWSEEMFRAYGLAPGDEPALELAMSMVLEEDRISSEARLARALEHGEGWKDVVTRLVRSNGEIRYVEGRAVCETDAKGVVRAVFGTMVDVTDRKLAELTAIEAEARRGEDARRMALAVEAGQVGIWEWDLRTDALLWDERMFDLYGIDRHSQPYFDAFREVLHPDDRPRVMGEIEEVLAAGSRFDTEFRVVHADGSTRYIRALASVVRDHDGQPAKMVGTNWDTTALRNLEASARVSEARVQNVIAHAHQAIVTVDGAGLVTGWNHHAELTFGWTAAEAIGRGMADLIIPPGQRAAHHAGMARFLATGEAKILNQRLELTAVHKTGAEFPIEVAISAIQGVAGWEFTAMMHDISDRKAEVELFENAFHHAPIGMALVGLDGRFLKVNDALCAIVGYADADLRALDFQAITHPQDLAADLALLARLLAREIPHYQMDKRYIRSNGQVVWVRLSVSLVMGPKKQPKHFIAQIQDLTDRREAEDRYRLLAEASTDIVLKVDMDDVIQYVSPAVRRYGLQPEDLLGRRGSEFIHPDDLQRVLATVSGVVSGASIDPSWDRSLRISTADGFVWMEGNSTVVRDDAGAPVAIVSQMRDITERRASLAALAEAEAQFRLLAENASDMIGLHDQDGRCLYMSPACRRVLGYEPQEMVGSSPFDFIPAEDHAGLTKAQAQLAQDPGSPVTHLMRMCRKDGVVVWIEVVARLTADTDGVPLVVAASRDVSARVIAQQDLEAKTRDLEIAQAAALAANRLMRTAEEVARLGYWTLDLTTGAVTWSEEIWRILNLSPDAEGASYERFQALRHPEDEIRLAGKFAEAVKSGEGFDEEFRLVLPNGEIRHAATRVVVTRTNGRAVSAFGVITDMTDLKRAQDAVQKSEARYRLMAENVTDMIVTTNMAGRTTFVAPSCRTVMGYEPEDLIGQRPSELTHPDDMQNVVRVFTNVARGNAGEPVRWRAKHKLDGRWVWLESNPSLLSAEADEPVFLDVIRDVTDQVEQENALAAATVAAEAAAAAKSEFLANMSHEIRTPLTAILGFTSLLAAHQGLDDLAHRHVQRVSGAGEALLAIINDVLDFSKLEAGQFEIQARAVAPVDVAQNALLMFTPLAEAKGLELDFEAEGDVPALVSMDPDRLRQILLNLIGNAIKFTEAGRVKLGLHYDRSSARLHLAVEDTGPGLTQDQQARLFQRFSQVDGSSTRRHGGTGLGLAICKGLTEAMGGAIGVTSELGSGSRFHFYIDAPEMAGVQGRPVASALLPSLEGVRVLVVDDNPVNRELARTVLECAGAEVSEASSGEEALQVAAALPYDVILLDIRMPGLDGPATLRRIRTEPGPNLSIPILAFSADADLQRLIDDEGFDGVIAKPIISGDLIQSVACSIQWEASPPRQEAYNAA